MNSSTSSLSVETLAKTLRQLRQVEIRSTKKKKKKKKERTPALPEDLKLTSKTMDYIPLKRSKNCWLNLGMKWEFYCCYGGS